MLLLLLRRRGAVYVRASEEGEDHDILARGSHGDGVGVEAEDSGCDGHRRRGGGCARRQAATSHGPHLRLRPRGEEEEGKKKKRHL